MFRYVVLIMLLAMQEIIAAPMGWSPNIPSDTGPKTHHGNLAGIASSADPATIYSWLFHLFSQSNFLSWLGQPTNDNSFAPIGQPVASSGEKMTITTSTAKPTTKENLPNDDIRLPLPQSMDLQVVRDFDDTAKVNLVSTTTQRTTLPQIARDFEAANVPVIQRTFSPSVISVTHKPTNDNKPLGINLPIVILGGPDSDRLVEGDTTTKTSQTQTPNLTIIRDFSEESEPSIIRDTLVDNSRFPLTQISSGSGKPAEIDIMTGSGSNRSPSHVSSADFSSHIKDELKVERDFADQSPTDNLIMIRDTLDEKSPTVNDALPGMNNGGMATGNSKPKEGQLLLMNPFHIASRQAGVR